MLRRYLVHNLSITVPVQGQPIRATSQRISYCWTSQSLSHGSTATGHHCCVILQLTNAGAAWLSWLWQLSELRLQHCSSVTDAGLCHISGLTELKSLDLEGCDGLSNTCLVVAGQLQGLTNLNLAQCPGIRGSGMQHLKGTTMFGITFCIAQCRQFVSSLMAYIQLHICPAVNWDV